MTSLSNIDLEIKFFFGEVDGKSMCARIHSTQFDHAIQDRIGAVTWRQTVCLPCTVYLEFYGKNMQTDTKVDASGNIVLDKHVRITSLSLDGFGITKSSLEQMIKLHTDQGVMINSYIGHNGIVTLDFDRPNAFLQLADIERRKYPVDQ